MDLDALQGGYVIGVGTDLVDVGRIEHLHRKNGDKVWEKILTPAETEYCLRQKNPYPSVAVRFAAKEAIAKAFTTGIGEHIGFKDINIRIGERGEPWVELNDNGDALLKLVGATDVKVSMTHTSSMAHAIAVIVRAD